MWGERVNVLQMNEYLSDLIINKKVDSESPLLIELGSYFD
jgi:hypothetical protein